MASPGCSVLSLRAEENPRVGLLVLVLALHWSAAPAGNTDFDPGAVLRFNLACAHCHEGECSGRLSLGLEPGAASEHIRRFGGDLSDAWSGQMQAILEYMKRRCAYAPLLPAPAFPLVGDALSFYRDELTGNYFVPLGLSEEGSVELSLALSAPTTFRVELISDDFEPLLDECVQNRDVRYRIEVDKRRRVFLRLRAKTPIPLTAVGFRRASTATRAIDR